MSAHFIFWMTSNMNNNTQRLVSGAEGSAGVTKRPARQWLAAALLAAGLVSFGGQALAAPIPFPEQPVQMTAREQPIGAFLQDFFSSIDVPVAISPQLKGSVNGNFKGTPAKVFQDLSRSFGFLSFYDGTVVHVYSPAEVTTKTLAMPADNAKLVLRTASEMRLMDGRNQARPSSAGIVVTGSQRFVDMMGELASTKSGAGGAMAGGDGLTPLGFRVYYLKYAWAHDVTAQFGGKVTVVPGVASILRAMVASQTNSNIVAGRNDSYLDNRVPGMRGKRGGTLGMMTAGVNVHMPTAETVQMAYGQMPGAVAGTIDPSQIPQTPTNFARVEADTRLNAVLVRDLPERLNQYDKLIEALDVEPQAIEIEATIIDLKTDRLRELGINWRLNDDRASLLFGTGTSSDLNLSLNGSLPNGNAYGVQGITPLGQGGFMSLVLGGRNNFIARINALQNNNVARVVSSPQVMTLSNVEALFDTTRSFYVRVAGRDDVDLFQVTAGTALKVTPHVFTDRNQQVQIKLLVQIEDGSFTDTRVDTLPVVERSSINTQALIMGGESLLIGGLVRESSSEGVSKVPFLGDVPIIGNLFKTTAQAGERVERMFLISPRLVPARRALMNNLGPRKPGDAVPTPDMPPQLQHKPVTPPPAPVVPAAPVEQRMPASGES